MPVRVSMRKIAEVAGVSVATVSLVLNNRANVCTAETAKRIRDVASRLGYRVNFGYKLMHSIPTYTVAVLAATEFASNKEHTRRLTLQLLTEFGNRGYAVYFYTLSPDEKASRAKIDDFLARGVENFVFVGMPFGVEQIARDIKSAGAGLIFSSENEHWRFVAGDSASAMAEILSFMKRKCGRDFRLVCFENTLRGKNDRAKALRRVFPELSFEEIIRDYTFEAAPEGVPGADFFHIHFQNARDTTRRLLEKHPGIKGIAYMNDIAAMGGASTLLDAGIKDVIVSGFNGDNAAMHYPYPIISVRHDVDKIVSLLVEKVISKTPGNELVAPRIIGCTELEISGEELAKTAK